MEKFFSCCETTTTVFVRKGLACYTVGVGNWGRPRRFWVFQGIHPLVASFLAAAREATDAFVASVQSSRFFCCIIVHRAKSFPSGLGKVRGLAVRAMLLYTTAYSLVSVTFLQSPSSHSQGPFRLFLLSGRRGLN